MAGIHHVTAISGRANRNLDFYTRILGLRFVKKTVNFDDPGTYHLYYGDETGRPGTVLTFFPWEDAAPGRAGVGLTQQTMFRVPSGSIGYGGLAESRMGVIRWKLAVSTETPTRTGSYTWLIGLVVVLLVVWLATRSGRTKPRT